MAEDEVKASLEDIPDFVDILNGAKRENYIQEIMETLTSRTQVSRIEAPISLNLIEYMTLRKGAIAWRQCSA